MFLRTAGAWAFCCRGAVTSNFGAGSGSGALMKGSRFASDSLLEEAGCKLSVAPKARTPTRLLILDHEQLIGRGFGSPDLTLAASKLRHAGAHTPGHGGQNARNEPRGPRPASSSPEEMVPPLLYVVFRKADNVNGRRFEANLLDLRLPPAEAARFGGRHAGFEMHPQS